MVKSIMALSLIVPVLNNFKVFAELMASVDYPVQPIILDNWNHNRGVAAAWNEGMRRSLEMGNQYAIISNDDASFTPGAIKRLYDEIKYKSNAVLVSPNQNNIGGDNEIVDGASDFFCFIVDIKKLTENVGWFDENIFPAYFEDNDMHRRITLAGLKNYVMADVRVNHVGSATQNFEPGNPVCPPHQFETNRAYFIQKWGGQPGNEQYTHPFNNPEYDLKYWNDNGRPENLIGLP
jgi:GT2 family glycosyltransferase